MSASPLVRCLGSGDVARVSPCLEEIELVVRKGLIPWKRSLHWKESGIESRQRPAGGRGKNSLEKDQRMALGSHRVPIRAFMPPFTCGGWGESSILRVVCSLLSPGIFSLLSCLEALFCRRCATCRTTIGERLPSTVRETTVDRP